MSRRWPVGGLVVLAVLLAVAVIPMLQPATAQAASPGKPSNVSPPGGTLGLGRTPLLAASAFVDPDGDSHAASSWQISTTEDTYSGAPLMWESLDDTMNKTQIQVPSGALDYTSRYYWRVRYQDGTGAWSEWSDDAWFTTAGPLVTAFTASRVHVVAGQIVQFTDMTYGGVLPLGYQWDFGDSGGSTLQSPSHAFVSPGDYTVTLTVADSVGALGQEVKPAYIHVYPALQAGFGAEPTAAITGYMVYFTPYCSGGVEPVYYQWDFGDGSSSTVQDPGHVYSAAGTYTVTLTATDSAGNADVEAKTDYITVAHGVPPMVTTNPASSVGGTTAVLNLDLTSLGTASGAQVYFETGFTESYGSMTAPVSVGSTGEYYAVLTDLSPNTTYHFRAVAEGHGTGYGEDMSFTTTTMPIVPCSVSTSTATYVTTVSARLNGGLLGLGTSSAVNVSFQYGTVSGSYDRETPSQLWSSPGTFFANITVLPGTTYYYRARVVGAVTVYGQEMSFTAAVVSVRPGSNCWAIVVGVADYRYGSPYHGDLSYTDDDARALHDLLAPIWGEDHVRLLVSAEATKSAVQGAISDWLDPLEDSDDTVLFFFSGHGGYVDYDRAPLDEGDFRDEFIVPYDTFHIEDSIFDDELGSWLGDLESQRQVVIIDSCYSGGFIGRGSASDLSRGGRVVLAGSSENETAWESSDLGFGVFWSFISEGFKHLDLLDANRNHEVSAEELFAYAQPRTSEYEATHGFDSVQHPQIVDGYDGELGLIRLTTLTVDADPRVGPVTIDGQIHQDLPVWIDFLPASSRTLDISVTASLEDGEEHSRYTFVSWSDNVVESRRTVTVSESASYVAVYRTQHYLSVVSELGETRGSGWYDAGAEASISVEFSTGLLVRDVFFGWSGDYSSDEMDSTVVMDGPKTVEALWRTDYRRLFMLIAGSSAAAELCLAAVLTGAILLWRRSRTRQTPGPAFSAARSPAA